MNGHLRVQTVNPIDFYFWAIVKLKVYGDRFNRVFINENELKRKIKKNWHKVANDVKEIQKALKQFVP